jgi:hypothetical protein
MSVQVTVKGAAGVQEMLRDYMEPLLPKRMQDATKAGAIVFKGPLKAEARKVSKRMGGSVSVVKAKRDRPATIVKFGKRAWFEHFVIGGTADHGPRSASALVFEGRGGVVRAKRVRGVPPNPLVDRVADQYEGRAYQAIDQALDRSEST